ncbi:DUF3017 domain-containing protein [Streptomyces sp. ISL-10]|uniref:DUF3017 domain-containing protein n=1 Tax=Streptomyces sp. ISL-10 TaxID=2819172 RepID=UPI001BED0B7B|nr:DUF3017 domain-containing protein [Streptomyces sp. ISL-10]MBT2367804.1 DUF3017 domain-containing protein [Streptomyces sp. ISL-10]
MGVRTNEVPDGDASEIGAADTADERVAPAGAAEPGAVTNEAAASAVSGAAVSGADASASDASGAAASADSDGSGEKKPSRRPPAVTRDTARPEGGGRAAPRDAPAPARQWPLLTVLGMTAVGVLIVGTDAFAEAFRVGAILIGAALITGAVLRRVLPSVGMLAVRSRFTDMITYGVLGVAIVLLALVTQPEPWLDIPILEDAVHFTVR